MTDTLTTETPVTKDDIDALRNARSVTFNHFAGRGYIRAHVEAADWDRPVFTKRQQLLFPAATSNHERVREISTDSALHGYGSTAHASSWFGNREPLAAAFYMAHHVSTDLMTVFELLRPGDVLCNTWNADNNTENHTNVGYHCDELHLIVTRGKKSMVFLIAVQVGPDNSARMIRRYGQ